MHFGDTEGVVGTLTEQGFLLFNWLGKIGTHFKNILLMYQLKKSQMYRARAKSRKGLNSEEIGLWDAAFEIG